MAEGDIGAVLDTLEFDATTGQTPDIIHVGGNIYAIAYDGPYSDGWLCTFFITSAGVIGNATIDTMEFEATNGLTPKIVNVSGDIYAIVYDNTAGIKVVTVDIDSLGAIENAVVGTLTLTDTGGNMLVGNIIHVSGDYFAISYMDNSSVGKVATVEISSAGAISAVEKDTLAFASPGVGSIIHVSGTMYAVAYTGTDTDGWVCTFNISTAGVIDDAVTATLEFDTSSANSVNIVHAVGDYFAISYKGPDGDGFVKTVPIYAVGTIGAVVGTLEFDEADGETPSLIKVARGVFAVAYEGVDGDGFIKTFTISSAGVISSVVGTLEFDTTWARFPSLLLLPSAPGLVAVAYSDTDTDGIIKTALIEVVATGESAGVLAVVENRLHYVDAYGDERFIMGTAV